MHRLVKFITNAIVLPFFLISALSPLYLSTGDDHAGIADLQPADNNVTIGILWVSCLIDSIVPDQESGATTGLTAVQGGLDDDMILIKKKRTLTRKNYTYVPVFEVSLSEPAREKHPLLLASTFDIPRDLIHSHSDGYHSLRTGLSPPSLLS